jgi:hypothetical protein
MKKVFLLAAIFVLSLSSSVISQTHTPETDLAAFIKFSRSMRQDFNSRGVESRKQWFSAPLYKLFLNELKRQDEYLKKNPTDMPYFGDGVPFQPIDETCKAGKRSYRYSYTVGKGVVSGDSATVPVTFAYPAACKIPPIVYKFKMVKSKAGWLVDDVDYGDGKTLVADLNRNEY